MAKPPLPKDQIVKKRVSRTYWVCPDEHHHESKRAAEKCLEGRPARLKRERRWREEDKLRRELARADRVERKKRDVESKAFKESWRGSAIFASDLDHRVSMALFAHGVSDRASFRDKFVTPANSFDIPKLGRVAMLHIDDYPDILRWLNSG